MQFSKERLLKQEEALVELDRSIDDWASKLERAENRRLRVRQKLLEHVAAALMLTTPVAGEMSPPSSAGTTPEPLRYERKDVESIRIYADSKVLDPDSQVLNLFTDIEQAIGRMCETTC